MSKSAAKRLLPKVPDLPGASRRAQYAASTKRALVDAALGAVQREGLLRDVPRRDRRRRRGHQGRALPPLHRQAGALRGGLRAGRGGRGARDRGLGQGRAGPVGEVDPDSARSWRWSRTRRTAGWSCRKGRACWATSGSGSRRGARRSRSSSRSCDTVLSAGPLRPRRADGGDVQPDLLRRPVDAPARASPGRGPGGRQPPRGGGDRVHPGGLPLPGRRGRRAPRPVRAPGAAAERLLGLRPE